MNNGINGSNGASKQPIWVESLWVTRKESITIKIGDEDVTREISVGMTVKAENRVQSAQLYDALNRSLSLLIEAEKDHWLNEELMRRESRNLSNTANEMDSLVRGSYTVKEPRNASPASSHSRVGR